MSTVVVLPRTRKKPAPKARAKARPAADPTTRYADDVVRGQIVAGPLVRLACQRHLADLERGKERGLVWRPEKAARVMGFFRDVLRLNGGDFEGKPFELHPSQQFIVGSLFGWYGEDGFRRFRVAYTEMAKGNGKSPAAAGIGLYMMTADDEPRAEVYSVATKKEQAQILFRDAVAMVQQSPALAKRIEVLGGLMPWNMIHHASNSFFRALASSEGQSGPRPHCVLVDELHEHPDDTAVEKQRAGMKGRRQPMQFEITNSGFDRLSVCYQHHDYGRRLLEGHIEDDERFAYICGLDEGDDWQDESVWVKANPLLDVTVTRKYLRGQVHEAQGMPSKQSIVKRLNFCIWVDASAPWIDGDIWRAAVREIDRDRLRGKRCVAALDLSGKNDLTALTLFFLDETPAAAISFFWTPADTLAAREERDLAPYAQWVREGFLLTTPGKAIDYGFAAAKLRELMSEYRIVELSFDRYRMDDFCRELDDIDLTYEVVEFGGEPENSVDLVMHNHGQGFRDMGPAVDAVETGLLNGDIVVEYNPVMNMCAANAVLTLDPAGSRKFDKRPGKSTGRIDGVVTLAMAARTAQLSPRDRKSFWE